MTIVVVYMSVCTKFAKLFMLKIIVKAVRMKPREFNVIDCIGVFKYQVYHVPGHILQFIFLTF